MIIGGVAPFVVKDIYDLIDFKRNFDYYAKLQRSKQYQLDKNANKLIKCRKCDYVCRGGWKKCPICKSKLK